MWYNPYAPGYVPGSYASTYSGAAGGDPRGLGMGGMPGLGGPGMGPGGPFGPGGPGMGPGGPFGPGGPGMGPGGPFGPGGPGMGPGGPFPGGPGGPFPGGPGGPFPGGPGGPFPGGSGGPFPGGPGGPFPGGPGGPFPPPPPPGPGPFPPPFPPGPFPVPFPVPIPIPLPFPGPGPFPPVFPNTVTVVINGDRFFPWVTRAFAVRWYPGITIYQALAATGAVRFGFGGQIVAVDGVVITGNVGIILRLNGRRIPESLIYFPLQVGDTVALELIVRGPGFPREDEIDDMLAQQQYQESFEYRPSPELQPGEENASGG